MSEPSPGRVPVDGEHAILAGLKVRWQTFRAPPITAGASSRPDHSKACAGPAVGLWVVDDPDALIEQMTQEDFDNTDERMPYFGLVWPSAEALAEKLLAGPRLDGLRVLDLGCGLGLCGLAAARSGARVTFFDWEPRALEIVAASVRAQSPPLADAELVVGDWRQPPALAPFDLVLAADVLYEERNGPAVARFLARHLKPAAEAWISDPGRRYAREAPALARNAGLELIATAPLVSRSHDRPMMLLHLRRANRPRAASGC